jgi:uncharacterized protein YjiS (DUF1127 family)
MSVAGPNGASLTIRYRGEKETGMAGYRSPLRSRIARLTGELGRCYRRAFEASLKRHVLRAMRNARPTDLTVLDDRVLKDIGISRNEASHARTPGDRKDSPLL